MYSIRSWVALAAACVLVSCGGGSGDPASPASSASGTSSGATSGASSAAPPAQDFVSVLKRQRAELGKIAAPGQAQWSSPINLSIVPAAAANLPDGKVLFWAAEDRFGFSSGGVNTYSTLFDPVTRTATERLVGETGHNMFCSATTMLGDGRLLVAGGSGESNTSLYEPATKIWRTGARLNIGRAYNANTLLADGSVLTLGGSWDGGVGGKHGEVWSEALGWRRLSGVPVDSFLSPGGSWLQDSHFWLIPAGNGKVFHAGPGQRMHWIDTAANGGVQVVGPRADDEFSLLGNTVMYDIGKVLKVGGAVNNAGATANKLSYVIDLNGDASVRKIAPMAYPRAFHNSVVLPNGQVVVIGGQTVANAFSDGNSVLVPELFDPATETFTAMPSMSVPRNYHSVALLLPDARVLSAGGGLCGAGCAANHADVQILSPHYLFNSDGTAATRPVITSAPGAAQHGMPVVVATDTPVAAFSLVRLSSTTHTVNNDQRRLPVNFQSLGGNSYRLDMPSNTGWALPGAYMLFALNADGTPSMASTLILGGAGAPQVVSPGDQSQPLGLAVSLRVQGQSNGGGTLSYSAEGLPEGLTIDATTGTIGGTPTRLGNSLVSVAVSNGAARISTQFIWRITDPGGPRYLRLTSSSNVTGTAFASMAEINLLGDTGALLARTGWTASADSQELVAENGAAANALDGNVTTLWHTQYNGTVPAHPHWFALDMGGGRRVGGLRYTPRAAGGNGTIAGYTVHVSADGVNWGTPVAQGDLRDLGAAADDKTVYFGNLARGKAATQSSDGNGATAARAVDGVVDGNFAANSVTHTAENGAATPWWEVDLGASYNLHTVRLWNRTDCCAARLDGAWVLASATPMTGRSLAQLLADPQVRQIQLTGTAPRVSTLALAATARYLRVQSPGTLPLSLAEVEVFGTVSENRAPTLAPVTPPQASEGAQTAFSLAASDPDGDVLTFSASGLPPGVNLNPATGAIAGFPSQGGIFNVQVGVSDGRGGTASQSFEWRIVSGVPVIAPVEAPAVAAGSSASFTASATSAAQYNWDFGDGSPVTGWTASPTTSHAFATPGVYNVTVSVRNSDGSLATRSFMQAVGAAGMGPAVTLARATSNLAIETRSGASDRLWVVNPDNDSVSVIDTANGLRVAEIAVGAQPRSVSIGGGVAVVANQGAATLSVFNTATATLQRSVALPLASQPFGVLRATDGSTFVALEATGRVLKFNASWVQVAEAVMPGVRHMALSADGLRLLATRFVSAPQPGEGTAVVATGVGGVATGGEVIELNVANLGTVRRFVLRHSDKADSTVQARGVPNYLGAPALSPDGRSAWVPSKQDNIQRGMLRDGRPLDFESAVRAISSRLDLQGNAEDYAARVDHDNSGVASAALYHPNGVYLFVALESSREVAVLDAAGKRELLRIDAGRAPQALALSSDGLRLYVHNFMDRSVGALDLTRLLRYGERSIATAATWGAVGTERLSATVLRGKQLFYDARDPRLARDAYLSCASCHNDGSHDGRTWDFTGFGEGLRNTIPLRGRGGAQGRLHWTANFDEVQDFERQIRDFARGTGLMTDAAFATGTRSQPLGDPKAGLSVDLDAMAAYLASLNTFAPSPLRDASGNLTPLAVTGRTVFTARCASCHSGVDFSDSVTGKFNNVGTLKPASGKRLGATLTGLDTPTLRDVWSSAPYLHDGSAPTIDAAVRAHTTLTITDADLAAVSAYVGQIGGQEARAPSAAASGTGLLGQYFNNTGLTGQPALTRVEAVAFDWGNGAPGAGIAADNFSARWTGFVEAPSNGTYRWRTRSDDGVRLWVNNVLVIDNWTPHSPTNNNSAAVTLVAGRFYSVRLEYNEFGGGAVIRYEWQTPGASGYVAVPAARLYAN